MIVQFVLKYSKDLVGKKNQKKWNKIDTQLHNIYKIKKKGLVLLPLCKTYTQIIESL